MMMNMRRLQKGHFPSLWQRWMGRNTTARTASRSHHRSISIGRFVASDRHAVPFSRWRQALCQLPICLERRWMSSAFHGDTRFPQYHQSKCIEHILLRPPVQSRWRSSRPIVYFGDFQSLGEMIQMAHDGVEAKTLTVRDVSAFWTEVPKFLKGRRYNRRLLDENPNAAVQLEKILVRTLEVVGTYGYRDLAQTTLGIAKIVKNVGGASGRRFPKGGPHQILHHMFIGNNSVEKQFIFGCIAEASRPILAEFRARELSNLIYAFGLAECTHVLEDGITVFDVFAVEAISKLGDFNSFDLSNMVWAYATLEISHPLIFKKVADHITVLESLATFWPQALSNIVWAYATLEEPHPELFNKVADHIAALDNLRAFNSQNLSNTVWAYATANESNPKLFKKMADHIVGLDNLRLFNSQNLANIVWAYATAKESHPELFEKVADHIFAIDGLGSFKPQELANTVWAYAFLEEPHPELFKKVADHIIALDSLRAFKPQELSNTVWAYATAKESHPKLFKKVADHIVRLDNLRAFEAQALSNIVWACATAKEPHPQLFRKVADHIVALDNLRAFAPQTLSNIVWAYATAKESHPELLKKVADHIVRLDNLRPFDAQNLANIVWAFATAKESHPELFKKVADHIVSLDISKLFNPQGLSNIVWAYATAKQSHPLLFNKIAEAAVKRHHEFTPQNIANFLWANATNGQIDQHVFKSFAPTAKALLGRCNEQELSNIAWSYAVANVAAPSLFDDEFIRACLDKDDKITSEGLRQLHQWNLWQEELKSSIRLLPSLQEKCNEEFIDDIITPSAFQDDVISQLLSIGLQPEEEVLTKSGYRLDAIVEVNGKKIAIEVDGPTHFLGREPTGSTILKHRQVANLDEIPVVSVPYWKWDKPGKDSGKKQQYLRHLLGLNTPYLVPESRRPGSFRL